MTDFVSEIAIFHISLLMFVSVVYLSFWLYFFVIYEAINSIQTIGYYILFGVCGTNLLVIGPLALIILKKEITIKPALYKTIIFSYVILAVLSLAPTPLLSNFASGQSTKEYLHQFFNEYGRTPYLMDYIQKSHQCCGYFDYTDYYQSPLESKETFNEPVPKSCCSELVADCEKSPLIFKQGCFVHAGSKTFKGWVQPFQGTGFLSVLLIPLALPLFQLLPTCFLHDAIQVLARKRVKNSQEQHIEFHSSGENSQPQSHLSRKNKIIRASANRRSIQQSSSSTIYVDGVHGDTASSVGSIQEKEIIKLESPQILVTSESTVMDPIKQKSVKHQSEKASSRKTNQTAAPSSRKGSQPVPPKKPEPELSKKIEMFLTLPGHKENDAHHQNSVKSEHLQAPEPQHGGVILASLQVPHGNPIDHQRFDSHERPQNAQDHQVHEHPHEHHHPRHHQQHHHENHEHHHDNHHISHDHHHEPHHPHHSFDEGSLAGHNHHHNHHPDIHNHHVETAHHHNTHHHHHEADHHPHNHHEHHHRNHENHPDHHHNHHPHHHHH